VRDSVAELAWQLQAEIGERHAFVSHIQDLSDENDSLRASVGENGPLLPLPLTQVLPEDSQQSLTFTRRLAPAQDKSAIQEFARSPPAADNLDGSNKNVRWGWLP